MNTIYEIELWDAKTKRYVVGWSGHDFNRAEIQFDKNYIRHVARRMIKVTREQLYKADSKSSKE